MDCIHISVFLWDTPCLNIKIERTLQSRILYKYVMNIPAATFHVSSKNFNSHASDLGGDDTTSSHIRISPYNINNVMIQRNDIETILRKADIQIPVRDVKLYQKALTHKSYIKRILTMKTVCEIPSRPLHGELELQDECYERLEFLGDQITNSIIVYYLYTRFPNEQEGFLTKIKTKLISTQFYARFARFLGLSRFIIMSRHVDEICNGRNNDKILENVFESFMGALFLDFSSMPSVHTKQLGLYSGPGYEICEKLVVYLLNHLIDFDDLTTNDTNYKDILLRYYQSNFQIVPRYVELKVEGPTNNRIFTMGVYDNNNVVIAQGTASLKKKAEQIASHEALKKFGYFKDTS